MVNPPVQASSSPAAGCEPGAWGVVPTAVPAPSRGLTTAPVPAPCLLALHGCQLSEVVLRHFLVELWGVATRQEWVMLPLMSRLPLVPAPARSTSELPLRSCESGEGRQPGCWLVVPPGFQEAAVQRASTPATARPPPTAQ